MTGLAVCGAAYCFLPMALERVIRDVYYVDSDRLRAHQLDVYLPQYRTFWDAPRPLVIWIHGGAWRGFDKSATPAAILPHFGYVAASINYRSTNEAKFPAQLDDVKSAIRYMRAHCHDYGCDPQKIGVWGVSSGGHLAALVGLSGCQQKSEKMSVVGEKLETASDVDRFPSVQAVSDWCGPTDFTTITAQTGRCDELHLKDPNGPVAKLLGGLPSQVPEMAKLASPVYHVCRNAPPFLIVHGAKDDTVPEQQSKELVQCLTDFHVPNTYHLLPNGNHDFTTAELILETIKYFDGYLKPH